MLNTSHLLGKSSEFEITAQLYHEIQKRLKGRVRGMVHVKGIGYLDLVFWNVQEQPVAVIEVKKKTDNTGARMGKIRSSEQLKRYLSLGLPVIPCHGKADIDRVIYALEGLTSDPSYKAPIIIHPDAHR